MTDWRDDGVILSLRPHGETAAIVEIFTRAHGRHLGLVRGGASRRIAPGLQPGTQVQADWRARLGEHLGAFSVEPRQSRAHVLSDRMALAGLLALCAMVQTTLPEREPHAALWAATVGVFDRLGEADWPSAYLRWELRLLEELGYGLDLSACAVTGQTADLAYVSPRTGRAVSRQGAGDWADRLLPLPPGLTGTAPLAPAALLDGLRLTGHFLNRELAEGAQGRPLPEARHRLIDRLTRRG